MNPRRSFLFLLTLIGAPFSALAQSSDTPQAQTNLFVNLLMTLLPIVLIGGFIWWLLKSVVAKSQRRTDDYIAKQVQHMERTERFLERIANAMEKKDAGDQK